MDQLFFFHHARREHPAVREWIHQRQDRLGALATRWFEVMRGRGGDVNELMHDGAPTACVNRAAFAYVNTYRSHVNVGFFRGADLPDPAGILQGSGKLMRHVKVRPGSDVDAAALTGLIQFAYEDIKACLGASDSP